MALRLGSVCSGVGGMDMGLEAAGFALAWLCEKDAQCRTVLAHRFPNVPVYDNLEGLADRDGLEPVHLLAGGTPCQDLSVAGRRAGLDGERSGLFFEFIRLADRLAPDWVLWENVDGALSSSSGEDFAVCLEGFTGFRPAVPQDGWRSTGVCVGPLRWAVWRVLDAQWFGVAQRRARVFVVAGTGSEPRPEVLLEPESVSGDSAPSRTQGEGAPRVIDESLARPLGNAGNGRIDLDHGAFGLMAAPALSASGRGTSRPGESRGQDPLVPYQPPCRKCGGALVYREGSSGAWSATLHAANNSLECPDTYVPVLVPALTSKMAKGTGGPSGDETQNLVAHTLTGNGHDTSEDGTGRGTPIVAFNWQSGGDPRYGFGDKIVPRRLTPRECERLMGWPDDWTLVDGMKDSPRYRMIGNGVVKNVAEWIGRRIMLASAPSGAA